MSRVNNSEKSRTLFRKKSQKIPKNSKKSQKTPKILKKSLIFHKNPKSRTPFEGVIYPSFYSTSLCLLCALLLFCLLLKEQFIIYHCMILGLFRINRSRPWMLRGIIVVLSGRNIGLVSYWHSSRCIECCAYRQYKYTFFMPKHTKIVPFLVFWLFWVSYY